MYALLRRWVEVTKGGSVPTGGSQAGGSWRTLILQTRPVVRRMAAFRRLDPHVADDVLQEACLRLLKALRTGKHVQTPVNWLLSVAQNLLQDVSRRRPTSVGPARERQAEEYESASLSIMDPGGDPGDVAMLGDLWDSAPELLERLPPPYSQVALLQLVHGWKRREVSTWLCSWNEVSEEACRAILRRTHAMLPFLAMGGHPRERWPGRYDSKRNHWYLTAPPDPLGRTDRSAK